MHCTVEILCVESMTVISSCVTLSVCVLCITVEDTAVAEMVLALCEDWSFKISCRLDVNVLIHLYIFYVVTSSMMT